MSAVGWLIAAAGLGLLYLALRPQAAGSSTSASGIDMTLPGDSSCGTGFHLTTIQIGPIKYNRCVPDGSPLDIFKFTPVPDVTTVLPGHGKNVIVGIPSTILPTGYAECLAKGGNWNFKSGSCVTAG